MSWVLWLLVPVGATGIAALWTWWRARPARVQTTDEAMRAYQGYLDALTIPARGTARPDPTSDRAPSAGS